MLFQVSDAGTVEVEPRARLRAGVAAATLAGRADVPQRKHRTGAPFRSRSR